MFAQASWQSVGMKEMRWLVILFVAGAVSSWGKPNIVFLLADDMGYGDLGCYGHPVIKSPNLDRLAEEGVRLTDCYSASPNCSPARTAILTGRHPYRVGMYDWARFESLHIPESELTVAEVLRDAGYQTMFAGKWHCSGNFLKQPDPGDHGFEHWLAHPKNFGENPKGFYRNGQELPKLEGWMSEVVIDEALMFLEKRDPSKPFLAMLWFSEPHTPVVAAEEFVAPYRGEAVRKQAASIQYGGSQVIRRPDEKKRATYYGCVSMMDYHIGRLLNALNAKGLKENTVVIFTSDNGPEHRPDSSFGTPGSLRGAKGHIHEGGYRVPGIVCWPGTITPGSLSSEPINGTDYLPSMAALAGANPSWPSPIDGVNIFPALQGEASVERSVPMMWWLYHARGAKEVSMRIGDYKMLANMLPQREISIKDANPPRGVGKMDFIRKSDLGNFTLYNLATDREEQLELSKTHPEKFKEMRKRMVALHREIRNERPIYELVPRKKK